MPGSEAGTWALGPRTTPSPYALGISFWGSMCRRAATVPSGEPFLTEPTTERGHPCDRRPSEHCIKTSAREGGGPTSGLCGGSILLIRVVACTVVSVSSDFRAHVYPDRVALALLITRQPHPRRTHLRW